METNNIMTTRDLAEYMKLNEKTVLKMAQKGEIPGVKIGKQWRFHLESIDRYLQKDILDVPHDELDDILGTKEHLIPLSRLMDVSMMDMDMRATSKKEVLERLSRLAAKTGLVEDEGRLLEELKLREMMLSTAVGNGIAIPHPRKPDRALFRRPCILMARCVKGVDLGAPDGEPVHLMFMPCAVNMMDHLRLMAKISKLLHVDGVIDRLKNMEDPENVIRMLLEMERESLFPRGENYEDIL